MKQTVTDQIVNKVSKGKINTVRVTREEMIKMVDEYFIQKAVTSDDYQDIWKVIKRGLFFDVMLDSKDGNYQIRSKARQGGRSLHKYVWIFDKTENIFYEYNYWVGFYGKFKKTVREKIDSAQKL